MNTSQHHESSFSMTFLKSFDILFITDKLFSGSWKDLQQSYGKSPENFEGRNTEIFGSEEYNNRKHNIMEEHQKKYREAMDALDMEAKEKNLMVQTSSMGAAVIPLVDGMPMSREAFLSLKDEEREAIEARRLVIMRKVDETYAHLRDLDKEVAEKMKEIDLQAGEIAISRPFEELFKFYGEYPEVIHFLKEVKQYTLSKLDLFIQTPLPPQAPGFPSGPQGDPFMAYKYKVNIFVDNSSVSGPPIIIESNPNWFNMFGKIERRALMGTYVSDHTMIKPGAVQLANGGYLILNIRDVLLNQGVWEGLKRVIKAKEVLVEDPWEQFGFFTPQGMRPQPMPVEFKIVVLGDDTLYQLLSMYDEDFWQMFKVKVDFDYQMPRSDENLQAYACFIQTCCDSETLLPFDRSGIAVTGSVNQKGEIQPIGGVNHKIEGFFDVCKAKGLTGDHGVLIPHQNIRNLMLREDVVKAVHEGTFHIYEVKTIDEGIEILTGIPAGEKQTDGTFPEGTVNYLVDRRLRELADGLKGFYGSAPEAV